MKKISIVQFALLMAIGLAVPGICAAAGDDCPPPSISPPDEPGSDSPETGDSPTPDDSGAEGVEEESADEGLFGSLSGASSSQLTIGILFVLGVIVGVVYLIMLGRLDNDDDYIE